MKKTLETIALLVTLYLVSVGLDATLPSQIPGIVAAGIKVVTLTTVYYWWDSHRQ